MAVKSLTKSYSGVPALKSVDIAFFGGEVHAVVGENGAGKSTLMQILAGTTPADDGEMWWHGQPIKLKSPEEASSLGIAIAFQELSLMSNLTIPENIFGVPGPGSWGFTSPKQLRGRTRELIETHSFHHLASALDVPVGSLPVAMQQQVEILRALSSGPQLLILDEPTSSLSAADVDILFDVIRGVVASGIAVAYISHHLEEVFRLSSRVTVLKDGVTVATRDTTATTESQLVSDMVGRELTDMYGRREAALGDVFLSARGVTRGAVQDISLDVRSGEIVGIAGLVGAGRTELARLIAGLDRPTSGTVSIDGDQVPAGRASRAVTRGIVYVTEDRRVDGLFLDKPIWENLRASDLAGTTAPLVIRPRQARYDAGGDVTRFGVVASSLDQLVGRLSGGNQQKVLIASRLTILPRLLIVDEPTRGVDVGARAQIYHLIRDAAATGLGVLVISSDLPEVLGLSDRILVMRSGRLVGELSGEGATEEMVIGLASGVHTDVTSEGNPVK